MLRITELKLPSQGSRLRLEGRLVGPWVDELRRVTEHSVKPLWLDLGELKYADIDGITLLRELLAKRVVVENVSPFLEALLGNDCSGMPPNGKHMIF